MMKINYKIIFRLYTSYNLVVDKGIGDMSGEQDRG